VALRQDLGLPSDERARAEAIGNLLLAADRAAHVYANSTALDHFTRALDLQPPTEERLHALLGRGEVWFLLGQYEQARADFSAERDLARSSGHLRWEAVALDRLGHSLRQQDEAATALEHLEQALAISRKAGDTSLSGHILNHIGFTYFAQERHAESIRAHEEARRLLSDVNDEAGLAESLHGLGDNLIFLGRYEEAIQSNLESIRICERLGNRSLAAENLYMIVYARQERGEYALALAEAERALATLTEIGDARNACTAHYMLGRVTVTLGDFGRALAAGARGLSLARELGARRMIVYHSPTLARAYRELEDFRSALQTDSLAADLVREVARSWGAVVHASLALDLVGLGQIEEAQEHIGTARQVLAAIGPRIDSAQEVAHGEGLVMLAAGRPAEARVAAQALADLAKTAGTPHWRVPALFLEAEATGALHDGATAVPLYLEAAAEAERTDQLPGLWRALAGLAEVQQALGRDAEAASAARRAREIIDRLAASVPDERLRAVFLQSPRAQRVLTLAGT